MVTELPEEPKNRKEQYLADIAGQDVVLPDEPKSREEQYLAYIAENGGGGGGGTSDFDQLSNRPKYNGTAMTGETDIPEVVTYTAGDGINITEGIIGATNTGKARELTEADYNANSSNWIDTDPQNFNCVAMWKMPPGIYTMKNEGSSTARIAVTRNVIETGWAANAELVIVGKLGTYGIPIIRINKLFNEAGKIGVFYNVVSNGTPMAEFNMAAPIDNLTSTSTEDSLSANQGKVLKDLVDSLAIRGAGAPTTSTAGQVGTLYEDSTNGDLYICTDATNPYVWEEVGAGGGDPTVVQTTGNSTTDVMSQKAVTDIIGNVESALNAINNGTGA